jgi:hypothetical protein
VQFPLNGLRSSITKDGIAGAICDQVLRGRRRRRLRPGRTNGKAYYTLSSKPQNVGPDSVGGGVFNNFPIPGGALAQDHFLVGGSGGGGAGSCPYFNATTPPSFNAGDAGAGGGGAIAFRAGSNLVLGASAAIEAKGGSGYQTAVLNNLPGGGGGSGGSILLQVAGNVGQGGLLTVAGGTGASLVYTVYPVKVLAATARRATSGSRPRRRRRWRCSATARRQRPRATSRR